MRHFHHHHRYRSQPRLPRGVSHHLLRPDLLYSDPRLRGEPVREWHAGLRLHVQHRATPFTAAGRLPDGRSAERYHAIHGVRVRSHRWDEPAGSHRSEVDCHTPAVRIADTDAYSYCNSYGYCNSDGHGYGYGYGYGDGYGYSNSSAEADAFTQASSHTAAATVVSLETVLQGKLTASPAAGF